MRGPRNGPRTAPVAWALRLRGRGQFPRTLPWRGRGRTFSRVRSWLELDGFADLGHGVDRDPARALGALVEDLHDLGGLLHVVLAALPGPGQRGEHVLEPHAPAVAAARPGGAATRRAPPSGRL